MTDKILRRTQVEERIGLSRSTLYAMIAEGTFPNATFTITPKDDDAFTVSVKGRDRWALEQLTLAGPKGCTPIDNPAPRWSSYVHSLRGLGVPIVTHTEAHEGPFAGTHARYELMATVTCDGGGATV